MFGILKTKNMRVIGRGTEFVTLCVVYSVFVTTFRMHVKISGRGKLMRKFRLSETRGVMGQVTT